MSNQQVKELPFLIADRTFSPEERLHVSEVNWKEVSIETAKVWQSLGTSDEERQLNLMFLVEDLYQLKDGERWLDSTINHFKEQFNAKGVPVAEGQSVEDFFSKIDFETISKLSLTLLMIWLDRYKELALAKSDTNPDVTFPVEERMRIEDVDFSKENVPTHYFAQYFTHEAGSVLNLGERIKITLYQSKYTEQGPLLKKISETLEMTAITTMSMQTDSPHVQDYLKLSLHTTVNWTLVARVFVTRVIELINRGDIVAPE